jgi:uncharacterized membrane protein YgaE (UPF0421/DUF939 family)
MTNTELLIILGIIVAFVVLVMMVKREDEGE